MIQLLQILTDSTTATAAVDSVAVRLTEVADVIAKDPAKFLTDIGHDLITFGLKLVAAVVIYTVGAWLIKRISKAIKKVFVRKHTDNTIVSFVNSLVTITLTVILIIISIGTLGVNTTSIAAVLAAGGMAIGMALSGTVQNFAGGIMILIFKPFKAGDYIKAQGYEGTVEEVTIVSTRIKTVENSIIVLPNGSLFNGNIDNFSHNPLHRVSWTVGVAYGSDAEKVMNVLLDIVKSDPRVIQNGSVPEPFVALSALKDSAVEFSLRVWVNTSDYWGVYFDINKEIYRRLPESGIEFPFPQVDVHMK